jgi:pSer/pThr/pTyr-binding forkhead associated (FHA) protein
MAEITLRILDGADRGRVYDNLSTPITIGREEGNTIQLNDERVSRFHLKIQSDRDKIVLTDLQSTNGTKVNGEDIQLRILRYGDLISVGRSVILFGSRKEIYQRIQDIRKQTSDSKEGKADVRLSGEASGSKSGLAVTDQEADVAAIWGPEYDYQHELHKLHFPELPDDLSPAQTAQLSELIEYVHHRIRAIANSTKIKNPLEKVVIDYEPWQQMLELQSRLAMYLHRIGEPPTD